MTVLITFIQKAIMQGVCMLFGADGEILTEKSGNLNLGVPGMMYMGGIAGLIAAFYYEKAAAHPNGLVGMILSLLAAFLMAAFGGLIFSVLTITLRANQNVAGLALTTFGVGFGNEVDPKQRFHSTLRVKINPFDTCWWCRTDFCSGYRRCLSCKASVFIKDPRNRRDIF